VDATLRAVRQRLAREATKRDRLAAGELGLDIEDMRPALEKLGLTYYETLEEANAPECDL
jgi:4-hydroxy-4-methyl-2-oxoglutarate aldolase